ncbi:MAG: hypothetical protein ABS76_26690 [Pelagibacterium sp. SCN 64-44]|nr:MAG: hypothetical protein ABS76_26690 [Pelagibacterium sp. SCN 64-44]
MRDLTDIDPAGRWGQNTAYDQSEIGYVVRMRRVYSLPESSVFTNLAEQLSHTSGNYTTAFRCARLAPMYKYKVVQLFAQQFSRIGLPDDVTALSALVVDDLVANIAEA